MEKTKLPRGHLKISICDGVIEFGELKQILTAIENKGYAVLFADNGNIICQREKPSFDLS